MTRGRRQKSLPSTSACACMSVRERENAYVNAALGRWRPAVSRIHLRDRVKSKRVYIPNPTRYKKTKYEIDSAHACYVFDGCFLHPFEKGNVAHLRKSCGFIDFFFHMLDPLFSHHEFNMYTGIFRNILSCFPWTENKGLFEQVYEYYLRSENTEKSKFIFFYRAFSVFAVSWKSSTDSSSCTLL